MKFKALLSPKQAFTFQGSRYQFQDGFFITEDNDIIEFLQANEACEEVKTFVEKVVAKVKKAGK